MNLVGFRTHAFRAGYFSKRFPALMERALEIFRHSYFLASARDYDERRADTTIKAIRSEEVNRSRRRKISARGSKDGKLPIIPARNKTHKIHYNLINERENPTGSFS